ncbi:deoxynucleoside kinase [Echinicola marina]|uniref:deoxynucleoside kinase n=1 Tax=Echinicola marina TaxID=2859768 RepID=UPI001CF6A30B|nr:deoxynucleoside kinase [Echinicola marina]UCS92681.1 deoxynucleoside kinase [Echinicola marina]
MHIAVSGNIGSGKSSLASMLGKHFNWHVNHEDVDDNPYLLDFYEDMHKWAFHLQVYFLNSRFNQIKEILASKKTTIQDRTIYEDAYIFAANLNQSGYLNNRDYHNYLQLFHSMMHYIQAPDLLIYLKADIPKLVSQIQKRGRSYEANISIKYLKNLNNHYENWIKTYDKGKILIIDVNDLDFVSKKEDFSQVLNLVDREINGLFA